MSRFHHKKGIEMMIKLVAVAVAMFLSSAANAEVSTEVKSMKGDSIKLPSGTECAVKERSLFGSGDESSISGLFAESGLKISKEKKSNCVLVVGAAIYVQHKNNPTSTVVTEVVQEDDVMDELKNFAEADSQDAPKSTVGETAGASVGSTFGLVGATAGALAGAAFDARKSKYLSASAVGIRVNLEYKDAGGKKNSMEIGVAASANPYDRPINVLRAAVKRVVIEIQAQPEPQSGTAASVQTEITTQETH